MTRGTAARGEPRVVRACHRGRDVDGVRREVLAALRDVMSVDAAFFATADPETLLFTGARAEEPLAGAQRWFLDNEFAGRDVNTFTALVASPHHVATLDEATRHERGSSARSREIMRPLGLGDEMRAALVVDEQCWGYLCLHREDGESGFGSADTTLLARVGPHIAEALRRATLVHGARSTDPDAGPGVVLLSDHLDVVAATPRAEELMARILDRGADGFPVPAPVHTAAAALLALEQGTASLVPRARARARGGGWLHVHAAACTGTRPQGRRRVRSPSSSSTPTRTRRHRCCSPRTASRPARPRSPGWCCGGRRPRRSSTSCTSPAIPCRTTSPRSSTRSGSGPGASSWAGCWRPTGDRRHGHRRSRCLTRAASRVRWSRSGTLVAVREASA